MAFRKDVTIDSDQLMADLGQIEAVSERVRLAGFGLAAPLLDLRAAQQRREVARLVARKGANHPEVAARQAALGRSEARIALFREELQRARLERPTLATATDSGLWGRVAEQGRPVEGVTVVASAEGKRLGFQCTGPTGGFAFEVPSDVPVVLSVRGKDGAELHRDAEGNTLKPGQQQYREIDLARGAERPCPEPPPDGTPPRNEGFPMVDLVGQREAAAMALLRTQGLRLAARKEEPAEGRAGIVLAQEPQAGTSVKRGDGVTILVGAAEQVVVPDVLGLTLDGASSRLKAAQLARGKVGEVPVERERVGIVVEQAPGEGALVARGSAVALRVGTREKAAASGGVPRLAQRAEAELRAAGAAVEAPPGFLSAALDEAGVRDHAALDGLLARDRQEVRDRLGLRTLAETDKAIAALKRARDAG